MVALQKHKKPLHEVHKYTSLLFIVQITLTSPPQELKYCFFN